MDTNLLYYGDNLDILRLGFIEPESVDLIYLDPPFNKNRAYSAIFKDETGRTSDAQIVAFDDSWHWGLTPAAHYEWLTNSSLHRGLVAQPVSDLIGAFHGALRPSPLLAYLVEMTIRLVRLHLVLARTGSLYLHCDSTASSYLRLVLDALFGPRNFRNEITWKRSDAHNDARLRFPAISDRILFYAKSPASPFHPQHAGYADRTLRDWYQYLEFPDGTVRRMTATERRSQEIPRGARRFNADNLRSPSPRPNLTYEYKGYKPHRNGWAISRDRMEALDRAGLLLFPRSPSGRIMLKRYLDEQRGRVVGDVWTDIPQLRGGDAERLGWPTQKPLALLDRVVRASSEPGNVVLDPFCGCGTALEAAARTDRQWIGIDISDLAVRVIRDRMARLDIHVPVRDPTLSL